MFDTITGWVATSFSIASGACLLAVAIYKGWQQLSYHLKKTSYIKSFKREKDIYKAVQSALQRSAADFVGFFQFHNTEHSIGNTGFLKVSMTQEAVREGLPSRMSSLKDVFLGQHMGLYEPILDGKEVIIPNMEAHEANTSVSKLLNPLQIKTYLAVPIQKKGLIVGYISISYIRDIGAESSILHPEESLLSSAFRTLYSLKGVIENIIKQS